MRYMVVIERGDTSWGAHVPDLPGCVAVGETRAEVLRLIREAIELRIDELRGAACQCRRRAQRERSLRWAPRKVTCIEQRLLRPHVGFQDLTPRR
jgi:hypothetical protein